MADSKPDEPEYWRVLDLYARYSYGVDSRDLDCLQRCFTQLTTFGLEGLARETEGARAARWLTDRSIPGVVHHAFNIVVVASDEKYMNTRADFTMTDADGIKATGQYADRVTQLPNGELAFASRIILFTSRRDEG